MIKQNLLEARSFLHTHIHEVLSQLDFNLFLTAGWASRWRQEPNLRQMKCKWIRRSCFVFDTLMYILKRLLVCVYIPDFQGYTILGHVLIELACFVFRMKQSTGFSLLLFTLLNVCVFSSRALPWSTVYGTNSTHHETHWCPWHRFVFLPCFFMLLIYKGKLLINWLKFQ